MSDKPSARLTIPAEDASLITLRIAELALAAGIPEGSGRDRSLHAVGNYTDLRTVIVRAAAPK